MGAGVVDRNRVDRNGVLRIAAGLLEQRLRPRASGGRLAKCVLAPFLYQEDGLRGRRIPQTVLQHFRCGRRPRGWWIETWKSDADMWNDQEILVDLKPSLVIEFGTNAGRLGRVFRQRHEADRRTGSRCFPWTSTTCLSIRQRGAIPTLCSSNRGPPFRLSPNKSSSSRASSRAEIFAILDSDD